jgi:hypothetical protein
MLVFQITIILAFSQREKGQESGPAVNYTPRVRNPPSTMIVSPVV